LDAAGRAIDCRACARRSLACDHDLNDDRHVDNRHHNNRYHDDLTADDHDDASAYDHTRAYDHTDDHNHNHHDHNYDYDHHHAAALNHIVEPFISAMCLRVSSVLRGFGVDRWPSRTGTVAVARVRSAA